MGDGIGDCGRGGVGTHEGDGVGTRGGDGVGTLGGDGVPGDPGTKETAMTDLCAWLGMSGLNTSLFLETVLFLF